MIFFPENGNFFNKQLSREDREVRTETNALYPVEKDRIEPKI